MKKYWRFQYPAHGGGAGLEALNVFGLRRRNAIPINWEDKMTIAIMGLIKCSGMVCRGRGGAVIC